MDFGLQDRVAIITGASYGIGRAIAESLSKEGAKVAICARNQEQLDQAAQALGSDVLAVQADMTQLADIENLFAQTVERYGRLDILVNNAGGTHLSQLLDLPDEAWQENIDVNLFRVLALRGVAAHLQHLVKNAVHDRGLQHERIGRYEIRRCFYRPLTNTLQNIINRLRANTFGNLRFNEALRIIKWAAQQNSNAATIL